MLSSRMDNDATFVQHALAPRGKIGFRGRNLDLEERSRTLDHLFFDGDRRIPYLRRFSVLMVFAASIASLGLMNNSAAVVIGAMLIAPLMTPIMSFAAALVQTWTKRQFEALLIVSVGALNCNCNGLAEHAADPANRIGYATAGRGPCADRTQPG